MSKRQERKRQQATEAVLLEMQCAYTTLRSLIRHHGENPLSPTTTSVLDGVVATLQAGLREVREELGHEPKPAY